MTKAKAKEFQFGDDELQVLVKWHLEEASCSDFVTKQQFHLDRAYQLMQLKKAKDGTHIF